ncbi:MAG: hypothetical protein R3265_04495 [Hyphomonas sp.]|nr:hypothetical protein [Hyphomonas sp.]
MLVKTPAIKLGVEVRGTKVDNNRLVLSGVANAMPCTVEIGGPEMVRLFGRMLRPRIIALFVKSLFGGGHPEDGGA